MVSGTGEFADRPSETGKCSSSTSGSGDNDASDFECNICFELAQDPIVTLCGHLFCWPCLFRWLRLHSHSHECPVCKALIQEEKLVPLYGRGGSTTDPRSKPVPGVEIPSRPAGQRPQTAPPPEESMNFPNFGLGMWGGFLPVVTAGFGNFAMLAGFGGLLPSIFSVQIQGMAPPAFDAGYAYPHGYPGGYFNGANHRRAPAANQGGEAEDNKLLLIIFFVILAVAVCLFS
ncbi:OLC1v1009975C1 [Oldenlandia corymbosa var. corymbosa]|uniref:E3 ubiquitin-protein ligase RMA n=1 Tax=Oldenlandia corymbosa var. corymbosa TaxID=529605 RepID=A0AAV1DSK5_OLDCO|nr:OLC1v1009975C1 [Oldenlandia corymbosa var. corymbosa]